MKTKHFLFILMLVVVPFRSLAQRDDFRFRHIQVEDGLPANSVMSMCQDSRGVIWMGTGAGLTSYYGNGFRVIENGLNNSTIYVLTCSKDDLIWVGTDSGIYTFDYRRDSLARLDVMTSDSVSVTAAVSGITEDMNGNIWFSTYGQWVFRYDRISNKLTQFKLSYASGDVFSILADSDNNIWIGINSYESALARFDKNNDRFEPYKVTYASGLRQVGVGSICEDMNKTIWLGTWNEGIQRLDKQSRHISHGYSPYNDELMHIHTITLADKRNLLIGSDSGLTIYNIETGKASLLVPDENNPYALTNQFVYPIMKDREGGIWVGTYHGGLNYLSPNSGVFRGSSCTEFTGSKSGSIVSKFAEDKKGNVWIGTEDNGLLCYSPHTNTSRHYMPKEGENSLSYQNIHALLFDGDDLWIGTYSGGINILDTRTGKFKTFESENQQVSYDNSNVYSIFRDRDSIIWVGTMRGINKYDRENGKFTIERTTGSTVFDIIQDRHGVLWFATSTVGILSFNPLSGVWNEYLLDEADVSVNSLYVDDDSNLWAATSGGLYFYNRVTDTFEIKNLDIPSKDICCIIGDNHILWLTTAKGLIRYDIDEGVRIFTKNDGLQSDQCISDAGIKTSDGKIYFGTINGFNYFYPHQIKYNNIPPKVLITDISFFNGKDGVSVPKELNLTYKDNAFTISYSSLSFMDPKKNDYAYILEGLDNQWNYVGNRNIATYTNIPSGKYTFKVKATNNDGIWSEEVAELKIEVHPFILLSTGFMILYLVLILSLIALVIIVIIVISARRHERKMQEDNLKKEKELYNSKMTFFTTIAHEIRTPLSLIIGPLDQIMTQEKDINDSEVKSDLNVVYRNANRLLSLVNQLLDFRKIEHELDLKMHFTKVCIPELIDSVAERFKPFYETNKEKLVIFHPVEPFSAVVDKESVTKILSNLFNNAGKYAKDYIEVESMQDAADGVFKIIVSNNGDVIKDDEKEKIFEPFYQSSSDNPGVGIGLSIVKIMAEAHKGKVEVEPRTAGGCTFIITIPLMPENYVENDDESGPPVEEKLSDNILISSEEASAQTNNKAVVLIVEDNVDMLDFLYDNLSKDFQALKATNGVEALEIIKSNDVSLVVCDWMMPQMNGIELCKALRDNQFTSHIPFILLTAKTDMESKIESMEYGIDAFIEKPFSVHYLKACIKNMLELRKMMIDKFTKMPLVPLSSVAPNRTDEKFLEKINSIIEKNMANVDFSVDLIIEKMGISRSGFFAKIKTLTDVTPNDLIQIMRLKKAAELLAEDNYMVSEISYMVGFRNPSYFSKCFLKQFGVNPIDFAKKQVDINNNDKQ